MVLINSSFINLPYWEVFCMDFLRGSNPLTQVEYIDLIGNSNPVIC